MIIKKNWHDLAYLIRRFIAPYWKFSIILIFLSLVAALFTSIQSLVIAPIMEVAMHSQTAPALSLGGLTLNNIGATLLKVLGFEKGNSVVVILMVVGIYIILAVLVAIFTFAAYLLSAWVTASAYRDMQITLHQHLLELSMGYFAREKTGGIVSRIVNDGGEVITSLDLAVRQMIQSVVQILFYSILLFRTASKLALITLVVSLLHLGITRLLRDRIRNRTADRFDALSDVSNIIQESLLSIRVIKSFAAEWFEHQQFSKMTAYLKKITMKYSIWKHTEEPLRKIADAVAISVVLLLSFRTMQTGVLTGSGLVMFVFLSQQTINPVSVFAQSLIRLQTGLGSSRKVLEILETKSELVEGRQDAFNLKKAITLNNISFSYSSGRQVLTDISLEISRGKVIAIVGPSGAGKSTLVDLVLRLYDPVSGTIMLDGIDIREFKQSSYRKMFGVVSQECLLFNASIRDNIVYGRVAKGEDDMLRAARVANAEEFILRMPDKFDTLVGDRGIRLSGGQRQRIAIARAIYASPDILILDEATSSLDTESERMVQIAIDKALENRTSIVIAHRLSTIKHADKIIVLKDGIIEAIGSHEELMQFSLTYKRLYDLQFQTNLETKGKQVTEINQ